MTYEMQVNWRPARLLRPLLRPLIFQDLRAIHTPRNTINVAINTEMQSKLQLAASLAAASYCPSTPWT